MSKTHSVSTKTKNTLHTVTPWWQREPVLLISVIVVALILRLPYLNGSLWLDEAAQALESARPWSQQFQIAEDFQPPLIHVMTFFALQFGRAEWWLRTVSALIPGLITIGITCLIGKKLHRFSTGWWASLLLATNSFHIFFSQELRPYSLPAMWAVLGWWILIELKERAQTTKLIEWNSLVPWLVMYLAVSAAGLYSSYLFPFLWLAQLVFVAITMRKIWWGVGLSVVGAIGLFLPWLPFFLEQLQVGGKLREQLPGWESVVSFSQFKSLPLTLGKFVFGVMDLDLTPTLIFMSGALVIVGGIAGHELIKNRQYKKWLQLGSPMTLFLIWLLVPLVASWLVSFVVPVVQPKRVLFLLPAFYLLLVYGAQHLSRKTAGAVLGIFLILNVFGTGMYYSTAKYQREDWRSLHQEIIQTYPADRSIAIFSFPQAFAPWRWYDDGTYPTLSTEVLHVREATNLPDHLKTITNYHYVLVFDYLRDLTDPDNKIVQTIESFGYREVDTLERPHIGFVRVFAQPTEVTAQIQYK
jgi:uncharacterized membrane protein